MTNPQGVSSVAISIRKMALWREVGRFFVPRDTSFLNSPPSWVVCMCQGWLNILQLPRFLEFIVISFIFTTNQILPLSKIY